MSSKQNSKKPARKEVPKEPKKEQEPKELKEPKEQKEMKAEVEEPKVEDVNKKGGDKKKSKPAKKSVKAKKTTKKNVKSKKPAAKKQTKKTAKKTEKKQEGGDSENSRTRYFKVMFEGGDAHGRFSGTKPKQAANKALTSILKTREKDGKGTTGKIKFSIVECTRGSKHKQYNYVGERVQLQEPMKVKIGEGDAAKEIEYKFNNRVMKDKVAQD